MIRISLAVLLSFGVVAGASAQNLDVIKQRKETFKQFLPHAKVGTAMMKGEAAFDLEKAKAAFTGISENAKKLPALFPADSKTGGETEALPKIWEDKADFEARFAKLSQDAAKAAGAIKDEASFKEAFPQVMGNCGGCHKVYRKPQS